ncbi:MAG: polar amino acid ABC transporter permease [Desulfuromonas sp.]|nr:MAG: polar amino acid ABC transporter permease [Desulfuromonas sp.]
MHSILAQTSRSKLFSIIQIIAFLLMLSCLVWGLTAGAENLGYNWHWSRIPRYLFAQTADGGWQAGPLLQGLWLTIEITAISLVCSFLVGLVTALMRLSNSPMCHLIAKVYLESVRNTPLLIQIFIIYFVFAPILDLGRFTAAILALSLFEGAYASEIIRAGILAIPKGQWEAASAIGMGRYQCYRLIILPQALRQMIPPLTSQGVSLVKDSALVSTIAIYDLTMQGQQIVAETFLTFEVWLTVAAIYLLVTLLLSLLVKFLEQRLLAG